ncbi:hypothetical protein Zmor_004058 [Zophobas morio]|uniref:Reverse transcriptase zinc-binding domain-containing protein n=1 Tax=Zophobas morio TaxID=2755281 RepID=A0AA38M0D7_9CUCU|nr:hypothetical protein Zmor_004058 [Zophobas morio]
MSLSLNATEGLFLMSLSSGMFGLFLLTGHGSMNEFLYKRGLSEMDKCGCGCVESVRHILFECRLYDEERGSCGWSEWKDEREKRLEKLLGSKEMNDGLMGFAVRVFEKRRIGVGEGEGN